MGEVWAIPVIGDTAAGPEGLDHIVDAGRQTGEQTGGRCEVRVARSGQPHRMLGGKREELGVDIELDDPADGHRAEPFAEMTLGLPGPIGQPADRRRPDAKRAEQPGSVS